MLVSEWGGTNHNFNTNPNSAGARRVTRGKVIGGKVNDNPIYSYNACLIKL